ncbi:hypothetical protein COX99_02625 [Candidatus Pacearchaeota archaeon CG_4_10_14_0_2_um_filter_31_10]|nr:MAG: hypothetical protein COU55_03555 [Candidatus Pacearchaeota archaeon CG10_big_fil_rev_8_21_14_0_10_31_59]PIZ80542.1 MAG: hypothetical protein COX99_02625 [Candidatus Pacearchaeota archaeon CG_4_10_14_0_2_um_filter_31_10]
MLCGVTMGKVSPISTKYIIRASFLAQGVVEKPDVIGAIFGQTEGLLGEELELRELQKKGKIGRIDAEMETENGKTIGAIEIPTSLDKAETTIIAAALETIDRIGLADVKIDVKEIEDVRDVKRQYIIERAKKLMGNITARMETKEMEEAVVSASRVERIVEYGKDRLPAGPDIETSDEIIVVEGRADVLNMLRYGIKNVIAMNGAKISDTIRDLSKEKDMTLFVDGDRGGILNAKGLAMDNNIKFIARAPDGKEVEELTEKEIISCLRNKLTPEEFFYEFDRKNGDSFKKTSRERRRRRDEEETEKPERKTRKKALTKEEKEKLKEILYDMMGSKSVYILNSEMEGIRKVFYQELLKNIFNLERRNEDMFALVIDGTVNNTIVKTAEKAGIQYIVAKNFAVTEEGNVKLLSL